MSTAEESDSISNAMNIQMIETNKNKPSLILGGYQYRRKYENKLGKTMWNCINDKRLKCKGKLAMVNGEVMWTNAHTCTPDVAKVKVKQFISYAKKRAIEEQDISAKDIFHQEIASLMQNEDLVRELPTWDSFKKLLRRARKATNSEKASTSTADDSLNKESNIVPEDPLKEIDLKILNVPDFLLQGIILVRFWIHRYLAF